MRNALFAVVLLGMTARSWSVEPLLLEAERFDDWGGWVNDCQFMDQMGSPFLLAHGLGRPVKDATTTVEVAEAADYHVWVRTRDWVATWQAKGQPGRFQVLLNGQPLDATFGTEGAEWHWQSGGVARMIAGRNDLALHDLTGFEGRCDAIFLTTDAENLPPDHGPDLTNLRARLLGLSAQPQETGPFDLVVTGGGIAGTCASLAAARLGLKVALIQDRPVLGGNNSSEVRVWLQGARNKEPHPHVGDIVRELEQIRRAHYGPKNSAEIYEDERKLALVRAEPNIALFLNHRVNAVEVIDDRILSVVAQDTVQGARRRFSGRWFVDSTGDGCVGYLAGADYDITLSGHMGRCNLWHVTESDSPQPFARCPWALDLTAKPFPGRDGEFSGLRRDRRGIEALGGWYWESGFDHDPFSHSEYVRDWNLRAMYGAWDTLKNVDGRYPNHRLSWAAYVSGKRESRRLMGDLVLDKQDVISNRKYPDGFVPTGWAIDLHLPDERYDRGFEGDAFIARAEYAHYPAPYWVPYRCLYSRNIENLFMAGRDISVTHEALGTVRVMRTGGCMGEVVGMAASVCRDHSCDPRDVYRDHLSELAKVIAKGAGKPPKYTPPAPPDWLENHPANLAPSARLAVSSHRDAAGHPAVLLTDRAIDLTDNDQRWMSSSQHPDWIEFRWSDPQRISAVRIVSGFLQSDGNVVAPITDFVWQVPDQEAWRDIPATVTSGNQSVDWHLRFPAVTTPALRLLIRSTPGDISRIWEIELYDVDR